MSVSVDDGGARIEQSSSLSQLLCAAKNDLQGTDLGGWFVFPDWNPSQV